jgi:hypothetical protein
MRKTLLSVGVLIMVAGCASTVPSTVPSTSPAGETIPSTIPETIPETVPETVPETIPSTSPPAGGTVHPGSFCSPAGATGVSKTGKTYTCKSSATDSRNRWRR